MFILREIMACAGVQASHQNEAFSPHFHGPGRYILSVHVADHTDGIKLKAFDDVGRIILTKPADALMKNVALADGEFRELLMSAEGAQYIFTVRKTVETRDVRRLVTMLGACHAKLTDRVLGWYPHTLRHCSCR